MAVLVLKYIGFELVPSLSEEVNFPKKDFWKVILSALIIPGILYTFAVLAIAGMAPATSIAGWDLPEARIVTMYKMPYIIALIALGAGILHALTTMAGFWLSSARALYGFSQMGFMPKGLLKTNSKGQPWIANIVVLVLSLFFVLWTPTAWVQYTYSVSCVAGGILYLILMIDFWVLRKRFPDREREYRAPGGFFACCRRPDLPMDHNRLAAGTAAGRILFVRCLHSDWYCRLACWQEIPKGREVAI